MAANSEHIHEDFLDAVQNGNVAADASLLAFRDPRSFRGGQLHEHYDTWESLAAPHCEVSSEVLSWIRRKVNVFAYFQHFRGQFKGRHYSSSLSPPKIFFNHPSCTPFVAFISKTILERLSVGWAVQGRGRLGYRMGDDISSE
jgi:hypothetical protein